MSYLTEVEAVLGFPLEVSWHRTVASLEAWGCGAFEAACIITMMRRRTKNAEGRSPPAELRIERLETAARTGKRLEWVNMRALNQIRSTLPDETTLRSWLDLRDYALSLGASEQALSEIFARFIKGGLTSQSKLDIASIVTQFQPKGFRPGQQ
jgi:hypothetical protein